MLLKEHLANRDCTSFNAIQGMLMSWETGEMSFLEYMLIQELGENYPKDYIKEVYTRMFRTGWVQMPDSLKIEYLMNQFPKLLNY